MHLEENVKFKFLGPSGQNVQICRGRKSGTCLDKQVHISESTNIWWKKYIDEMLYTVKVFEK